jgi:hypothetical protein
MPPIPNAPNRRNSASSRCAETTAPGSRAKCWMTASCVSRRARFANRAWGRVANTALGGTASFLALEAVGATAAAAVRLRQRVLGHPGHRVHRLAAGVPIGVCAARFGYIGSTITLLVYASFTFIFFAPELAFDIPSAWGYLLCAPVVIPLVTHGVTVISQLQVWKRPLWLGLLAPPHVCSRLTRPGLRAVRLRCRERAGRRIQRAVVRRGADGGYRADHANGRAARLPAFHARKPLPTARAGPAWQPKACAAAWRFESHHNPPCEASQTAAGAIVETRHWRKVRTAQGGVAVNGCPP